MLTAAPASPAPPAAVAVAVALVVVADDSSGEQLSVFLVDGAAQAAPAGDMVEDRMAYTVTGVVVDSSVQWRSKLFVFFVALLPTQKKEVLCHGPKTCNEHSGSRVPVN